MSGDTKLVPVLFVDDEENILKSVKRLFMDEPFEVLTADSGAAGLAVLNDRQDVGVIVSDQRMPGMSGAEFLEKSRPVAPEAVRVVLTGYADISAAVDAINKGGAWKYLAKPWEDENLVHVVREAAERFTLMQKNRELTEIVNRQNDELKKWNAELEFYVQQQTIEISKKNEELKGFNDQLKKNFHDIIESLAGLLELRDKTAMNHSRNVAELAVQASRTLCLPPAEVDQITVAALLHDIGKIGMPDLLLAKGPEAMNADEKKDYLLHAVRGQAAIDAIEDLRPAGMLIRHHHEAFNGTGYPDNLKGDQIPLGSRIIAAADYFDRAFSQSTETTALDVAVSRLRGEAGKILDPDICRILEKPLRKKYAQAVPRSGTAELQIALKDLAMGMVVSRDVRSGTGILLISKGTTLDAKNIQALKRYEQVDPAKSGVYVWAKK